MTAQPDDGSWGIMLGWGALTLVVLTCLDAAVVPSVDWRLVVIAAAVAVIAERAADARTALGCAVVAFALADGFLQHDAGALRWDARLDYPFVLGLLGATALGMCAGQLRVARRRGRRMLPFLTMLRDAPEPVAPVTVKEPPRIGISTGGDSTVG
jgi:hypothetical protein